MPLRPQCLPSAFLLARPIPPPAAQFHTTSAWRAEVANYYETLGLDMNASAGAIKKQFYSLSKTHHPDHNPNDPEATNRFVRISEAYTVLGNPRKRERYDQDMQRIRNQSMRSTPRGSHSSSSTPFGSRPASGLSRRRSQFKGPPPSFYRSGGWGAHSEKRQSQAGGAGPASTSEARGGGFGFGQGHGGWNNDVPHWDREGHYRTQEQQDLRRQRRLQEESVEYAEGGSMLTRFFLISAVVSFAFTIPTMIVAFGRSPKKRDDS